MARLDIAADGPSLTQERHIVRCSWPRALAVVFTTVCVAGATALPATAAKTARRATPPANCNSSFDPYGYTQAAVSACGYSTFPENAVHALPDGGSSHDYNVLGTLVRVYVAPQNFVPSTATNTQLDEYGFPPRPTQPAALAAWTAEMTNWRGSASAPPFLELTHTTADTLYSPNWSGYMIKNSSGGTPFAHAESTWYEPDYFPTSGCSTSSAVIWAGLGGFGHGPLGQDGTAFGVGGLANHQAWTEIVPLQGGVVGVHFSGHPDYRFDASTRWLGNGYRFFMYDWYTQTTYAHDEYVGSQYYSGDTAEAVAERPGKPGGGYTNLSNFATMTFDNSFADGVSFDSFSANGLRNALRMTDTGDQFGTPMATPSDIGTNGYFTDTYKNCN